MTTMTPQEKQPGATHRAITTRAEAEAECATLERTMNSLLQAIEEETALVRAGKLRQAGELQPRKAELMQSYIAMMNRTRNNSVSLGNLAPNAVAELRRRHAEFQAVLKINLAVLSTAREVAEGLVRTVAKSVGSVQPPRTYGRNGSGPAPATSAHGIAVNRNL